LTGILSVLCNALNVKMPILDSIKYNPYNHMMNYSIFKVVCQYLSQAKQGYRMKWGRSGWKKL
jgi:hypothetical protein